MFQVFFFLIVLGLFLLVSILRVCLGGLQRIRASRLSLLFRRDGFPVLAANERQTLDTAALDSHPPRGPSRALCLAHLPLVRAVAVTTSGAVARVDGGARWHCEDVAGLARSSLNVRQPGPRRLPDCVRYSVSSVKSGWKQKYRRGRRRA